jgi:Flp pilus assembly pilin Flp
MVSNQTRLRRLRGESGQDLIEYALVGAFVALLAYGSVSQLGLALTDWYTAMSVKQKKSNCSAQGMAASGGKCHGG